MTMQRRKAADGNLILGVDIGGSKIHFGLWDGKKVVERRETEEVSLETLKQGVSYFEVRRVGIGVPGIVDFKTGKTLRCQNLKNFDGLNLKKILKKDVRVDNDANCFLRAEALLGAGKGYKYVLGITMGTGIGGGIVIKEKSSVLKNRRGDLIYKGADGSAGEFGQMVIQDGKTWEELYRELRNKPDQAEEIHSKAMANLINIFNPELIVIGGRAAKVPNMKSAEKYILSPLAKKAKIVLSRRGDDAGAIGAALLFG